METKKSTYKIAFFVSVITGLVFCIILLCFLVFLPSPSFLSYLSNPDTVVLADPDKIKGPFSSYILGELFKNGNLVSLKDVWSFQTGFYQTIITFLIAINGLIAAFSVIYIKTTSEEKVEETTRRHINSTAFEQLVKEKVQYESRTSFEMAKKDFETSAEKLEESLERLVLIENENQTLRQQVRVISGRIAQLDNSEEEGKEFRLSR